MMTRRDQSRPVGSANPAERGSGRAGERGNTATAALPGLGLDPAAASSRSPASPLPRSPEMRPGRSDSIRRIRSLLRKELLQIFRDKRRKRVVLIAPIVQLLLFGYAVTTDVHDV